MAHPEQGVPAVWGQVGFDATHRSQAAQTGGRHQATVVRLVLVRSALSHLCKTAVLSLISAASAAAEDRAVHTQITAYITGSNVLYFTLSLPVFVVKFVVGLEYVPCPKIQSISCSCFENNCLDFCDPQITKELSKSGQGEVGDVWFWSWERGSGLGNRNTESFITTQELYTDHTKG